MFTFSLRLLVVSILLTPFWGSAPLGAAAQSREKCVEDRAIAENRYLEGRFDEAVALLQQCLDREALSVDEAVQVYRLISLAHLNNDAPEQARQAVRNLLLYAPTYQPNPVQDPPSYTKLVAVVREALEAQALPEVTPEMPVEQGETPVLPEEEGEEAAPESEEALPLPPRVDQPQAFPDQPPPDERVVPSLVTRPPTKQRRVLRTPGSWLLATGGAVVLATAVALVFGGRSDSSPAPPR